ncbi:ATPase AAA [Luedemannella flava]|uniref:ATPase AAA n=1 Tax=Luedemannella flava TaxID=349316 RepID=A0ABP4YIS0_9ACTN
MTLPLTDPLDLERDHLVRSRAALARMRSHAEQLFSTGDKVAGDAYSSETLGRTLRQRVAELADDPRAPLFFGKLTFDVGEHAGSRYHVGRRHITDDAGEPLVLDWRAPLSRTFYQASARDPQGVAIRRRFGWAVGATEAALSGFEDEHLDRGEELGTASRILTEEIERPRVGPMRDIVATIQPEQDVLVRADLDASICVQGAPGTGKTAVGLHRAAYLLYAHRERLRRSKVLVLGPNRAFLSYIAAVLPALGEIDVEQSTVDELIARVQVRGTDAPATASLKHDPRLAVVLRQHLRRYVRKPVDPLTVTDGSWRWRISVDALVRIVDDVRREDPPHALGRERVLARVVALLLRQAEAKRGDSPPESWQRKMARSPDVRAFLDFAWPAVTPEELVFSLLSDPSGAADVLSEAEIAALAWEKPARTVRATKWSAADAVLIDEAAGLIERLPSYGHIVIDEAQDLSPMQCRAIARRSEHGSFTLLGDLAQGTAPWASRDWADTVAHLGKPGTPVVPLTTGFRVPAAVVELANRLLPALDVAVPPAESLRRDGTLRLSPVESVLPAAVAEARAALEFEGSVAVIAPDASAPALAAAVEAAGLDDERVIVLPASLAKGLEYDHVVVVEPADIVAAEERGLHRLYVVLTRAVSRLVVVHARPLPDALLP